MAQRTTDSATASEPGDQWRAYQGAPTGTDIECEGWHQEAALRMLNDNLDPQVAERPEDLVVYGGTGRAARSWDNWEHFHELEAKSLIMYGQMTARSWAYIGTQEITRGPRDARRSDPSAGSRCRRPRRGWSRRR